jgi:hypothetical protein
VVHAGVEQNAFGGGGFTSIDVGRNTDIAVVFNGGSAGHKNFQFGVANKRVSVGMHDDECM